MKTQFIENGSKRLGTLQHGGAPRGGGRSGFSGKAVLVVLALGALALGAGFYLKTQGKALPEPLVTALAQVVPAPRAAEATVPSGESDSPQAVPQASPAAESLPSANPPPAPVAAATPAVQAVPAGPKVAPAGTVYLAKRITITSDTGISSFPRGTLVVVTSKKGGKIQGSIGGTKIQISEAEATSVLQD